MHTAAVKLQIPVLNDGIRKFYDQSSGLWESMWGDHMHHGFYTPGSRIEKTRAQAQVDMIDEVLAFSGVDSSANMVDVGCGIGGSSRCATDLLMILACLCADIGVQCQVAAMRVSLTNVPANTLDC